MDTAKRPNEQKQAPQKKPMLLHIGIILGIVTIIVIMLALVDLSPDYSRLKATIHSGSTKGNYFATVEKLKENAVSKNGSITNKPSNGSLDNVQLLKNEKESCQGKFGLAIEGLDWHKHAKEIELIGRLTEPESMFFIGPKADDINSLQDMQGIRIGIGPVGSGTAVLAEQILTAPKFEGLSLQISNQSATKQLKMLENGKLDLGVFILDKKTPFVENAITQKGMQIAAFNEVHALAARLPFVRVGAIPMGFYDPVRRLPKTDRAILEVDTLIIGNGCSSRSELMSLLSLVSETYPDFIRHNRSTPNDTGLQLNDAAKTFFDNGGPELLDEYVPWLADIIPLGNIVTIAMAISLLFNAMGAGNRFRLWRIDVHRVNAEIAIEELFGLPVTVQEINDIQPSPEHKTAQSRKELQKIIDQLSQLAVRCRKQSTSMLVPMGQEMAYRYQENIIKDINTALRNFQAKMDQ